MELVLISPEQGDLELDKLQLFFEEGLDIFHIRKPNFNEKQLRIYLSEISPKFYNHLVLHSFHHLALEYGLLGIHFTEKEKLKGKSINFTGSISASFHSLQELMACKIPYNYVFLSPVFNSISKTGYISAFKKEDLVTALPSIEQKIIALGGVDVENLKEVKEMGFYGVALLGAVWNSKSPLERFILIKEELEKNQ